MTTDVSFLSKCGENKLVKQLGIDWLEFVEYSPLQWVLRTHLMGRYKGLCPDLFPFSCMW